MKTILIALSLSCTIAATLAGESTSPPATNVVRLTPDYLGDLADEMGTNNPALRAAYARTNAAGVGVSAVRTWEDPMIRLGGMAAREEFRASDGDLIYGVEQKLPLFGKPESARRVAQAQFATETANADYQFQILRREFAKAAFRAALADEIVAAGEQDLAWLDEINRVLQSNYGTGQATLTELVQIQNERSKRLTQLETDREQLHHERVTMNRLLNRDLLAPWPRLELPPVAGRVFFNQQLIEYALQYEPKVKMMRQQIKQTEAEAALTRRQRLPDVSAGVEARNYTGDGSFRQGMLVFSMNLPWGNGGKYRSDIRRADEKVRVSEFELADYEATLREEIHLLTVKIDAARREALLYRDEIIPRTQTTLESARSGWQTNKSPFRDVLDARRMLIEARLMYLRGVAEQYQMMSELVLCCGIGDLGALEMIGAEPPTSDQTKSNAK